MNTTYAVMLRKGQTLEVICSFRFIILVVLTFLLDTFFSMYLDISIYLGAYQNDGYYEME
jgi:hypothetical protein